MAQAFLDDLEVSSAGEEPGGVGVAQVMDTGLEAEVSGVTCRIPAVLAEPVRGDVRVGVDDARLAWVVLALGSTLGAIRGIGASAVVALALAEVVRRDRAVGVGPAIGSGELQGVGLDELKTRRVQLMVAAGEQEIIGAEGLGFYVGF